jgi:hypothetical protein
VSPDVLRQLQLRRVRRQILERQAPLLGGEDVPDEAATRGAARSIRSRRRRRSFARGARRFFAPVRAAAFSSELPRHPAPGLGRPAVGSPTPNCLTRRHACPGWYSTSHSRLIRSATRHAVHQPVGCPARDPAATRVRPAGDRHPTAWRTPDTTGVLATRPPLRGELLRTLIDPLAMHADSPSDLCFRQAAFRQIRRAQPPRFQRRKSRRAPTGFPWAAR